MDYDELFPGRFLKSGQFKGRDVTLTMADVVLEQFPEDRGGTRTRGVLSFKESQLCLVLNRTNAECIKAMFGRETNNWKGKRVTLYPAKIAAFGGSETAIRVRGSPDIVKDMDVEIRLPRRSPKPVKMRKTAVNGKAPTPAPEPEPDVFGGEAEPGADG